MILIGLVLSLTIFLFSCFTLTYRLQSINRAVFNTPVEIFELSIPIANIDETDVYFDKTTLENKLNDYYESTISDFFKTYEVNYYYYNQADKSICVSEHCNAVEITISGNYFLGLTYEQSLNYEIHRGAKYGQ